MSDLSHPRTLSTSPWKRCCRALPFAAARGFAGCSRIWSSIRSPRTAIVEGYTLGVEVFDRGIRFDPQCDSIVRVEAFNLRKALRAYYRSEGATDVVTISVPKGGYRATFRLNEKPPAAILDDPERLCGQVEWSLLRGNAARHRPDSTLRATRHRSLAGKARPPRCACLHRARGTGTRTCGARRRDRADAPGSARGLAVATRREAMREFYATIHRIVGTHKEASIAAAHRWVDFAPRSATGTFLGRGYRGCERQNGRRHCLSAAGRPASALRDFLSDLVRVGAVLYRSRGRRPASPAGHPRVRPVRLSGELLAWSAGVARTPVRRGARCGLAARIRCPAARKRSPRWGYVEATSESVESADAILHSLAHSDKDTSLIPVSARSTSRLDVLIALLESGPSLRQKETGNWAGQPPTRVGMRCVGKFRVFDRRSK